MDLKIFGSSAPQNGLPGGDSARVVSSRSGAKSFADAFQSVAVENKKINKKQIDSEAQGGSEKGGLAPKKSPQANQHSEAQTPHPAPDANHKALGRSNDPAVEVDENGKSLPPSGRQSLPSSGSEGQLASESTEPTTNVSGSNSEINASRLDESIASHEQASALQGTRVHAVSGQNASHGSPAGSASILEPRMEARVEASDVQVSTRSIGADHDASIQSAGLRTKVNVDVDVGVDVDVDLHAASLRARDQIEARTAASAGQTTSSDALATLGGLRVEEGADPLTLQPWAIQAARAVRARGGEAGTTQVAIQPSTTGSADAEPAITSLPQPSAASLMHAHVVEEDGPWAASLSASGTASHSPSIGGATSALQLTANLVEKPVALTQAVASANSHAMDLEPASILGLNVAQAAKGVDLGEIVSQARGDAALLQRPELTPLTTPGQTARMSTSAPALAGMNLQSAPTALAELDLGRMTKVALDPQQQANQTALRAEVPATTNARASGWSDGVRQQLERARFAAVMPQAKQTATVDSVARLPMVESLLSSLGQQTSPGAKLGVEPVSLSSVKAGTQGLDPALLTQNGLQQSVTQAGSKGSQSLNPLYQGAVNARIEQTAWMAQIANHAKMAIKDDFRSVEIRLTPAHLGTIEILVSQDDEQTQLAFFTKHAQVREALEGQMSRLQKLFEEDGLKLGDAWVSDQSLAEHREHQTGSERDQDALTPLGFALDQRDAQLVGSMTAQKVDSSAMLDVWA